MVARMESSLMPRLHCSIFAQKRRYNIRFCETVHTTLNEQNNALLALKWQSLIGIQTQTHPFKVNFIPNSHSCYASVLARDSKNMLTLP